MFGGLIISAKLVLQGSKCVMYKPPTSVIWCNWLTQQSLELLFLVQVQVSHLLDDY